MRKLRTLQLHLTARDEQRRSELLTLLQSEVAPQNGGVARTRLAVTDPEAATSPFAQRLTTVGPLLFDATLELTVPSDVADEPLLAHADALRPSLAELVDPEASAVLLGDDIEFTPGEGAFQLNRLLRRLPHLTLGRFSLHWATLHGELGRRGMGPTPYRQLHRDPEPTTAAAKAAGVAIDDFDGNAIVLYPDANGTPAIEPPPGYAEELYADGIQFVNRPGSVFSFGRVVLRADD